jgi:membrane associated rhomboid family serine protease
MFALYMFGAPVERVFGPRRYLIYYFVCVVSAAIVQLLTSSMTGAVYPTVGASGGVFGLLLAYAIYFPHNRVILIFPPIPMPARVFVVVYAALELFLGVTGTQEGVAHFAHLGGLVGGVILLRFWRSSPARWRS